LWTAVRNRNPETGIDSAGVAAGDEQSRLQELEARLADLKRESAASSELIKSLAEQNSRLVDAVEILRVRTLALLSISCVLVVFAVGLAIWLLSR